MNTVLETQNQSTVRPKRFLVEDFRKMTKAGILPEESGWEVIDGFLVDKRTIGSKHAGALKRLSELLRDATREQALISVQDPVQIDEYNEPEPDICLLKRRDDFYSRSHPTPSDIFVIIEVSDSTLGFDRDVKIPLYAEAKIAEVWLINLNENSIEQYSSPQNGRFGSVETFRAGQSIRSVSLEGLALNVDEALGL